MSLSSIISKCKFISSTIIVLMIIIGTNPLFADEYQFTSKNKKAIKYYNIGASDYSSKNYNGAITNLEKSLTYDSGFIESWLLLGDIFSDLKRYDEAISAYNSALEIDSTFFPPVYYFLANIYYEMGRYKESSKNYSKLLTFNTISSELQSLAIEKLIFSDTSFFLVSNPVPTKPINVDAPINTGGDEYINYVDPDYELLMFTKRTKMPAHSSKKFKEDLFYSILTDTLNSIPEPVNLSWRRDGLNMGTINFSTDGRIMYFTGCYWPGGNGGCDLYFSKRSGSIWQEPTSISDKINTESWESQPIISSDGKKLFFASKRPGGKGGSDIWMSIKLRDNSWSPPINLGDSIKY